MYLCVCYVAPRSSTVNADSCPYDALQLDIAEAQNAGGCIVVCGDMNVRTAALDDYIRKSDRQDYVDVLDKGAYLNSYIPSRSNCDKKPPNSGTWSCELLQLCRSTELLIATGRTLGDVGGEYTFTSPRGQSTVDYFIVCAEHLSSVADMILMHDAQYCNLSCDVPHGQKSDHFPLQLDLAAFFCSIQFVKLRSVLLARAFSQKTRSLLVEQALLSLEAKLVQPASPCNRLQVLKNLPEWLLFDFSTLTFD